ncbi:cobyrinic acid a,c-diamide synthase [Prosthecomicrobium hirschii]|uniref:Cobyrinic acid a,c-diamide synthase n=1 Tax=Prosthecodimorpha hirschii TaxID=665126 RepID=A0A0P6WF32_9HYPH|nr:ParA family partition ATPase [Prosthecomicrobium hirschii]KPL55018.1 cobyrinic acid a,c-diamide synthase [Prosthecomicrobium hirschii]
MTGKIVAVSQQKGGSGKTTLSAHLAVALQPLGRVAILDVDPQGSLGEWFEKREARLGEEATGLTFRTASGWGAKREARTLARDHDLVVIDTPPKSDLDARYAVEAADLVIIPIQPSPVDLWASEATLTMVERESVPALFVLNRVSARSSSARAVIEAIEKLGRPISEARLGDRVAFASSMGIGSTAMESEPGSKAALEALAIAMDVKRRLDV